MDIEVPHDWGATKRPSHTPPTAQLTGTGGGAGDEHPSQVIIEKQKNTTHTTTTNASASTSTTNIDELVQEQQPASSSTKRKEPSSSSSSSLSKPTEPKMKVLKSPLGPRSVFNAVTHDAPEKGQLKQMVMAHLSKPSSNDEAHQREMEVHCLLSKLPYQKMLSDLFTKHDKEVLPSSNLPYVTRAYEESFMREPLNSTERLCAKNENCECMFIDPEKPFVAVEFLLPGEKKPATPHLCVVCCRYIFSQSSFYAY